MYFHIVFFRDDYLSEVILYLRITPCEFYPMLINNAPAQLRRRRNLIDFCGNENKL